MAVRKKKPGRPRKVGRPKGSKNKRPAKRRAKRHCAPVKRHKRCIKRAKSGRCTKRTAVKRHKRCSPKRRKVGRPKGSKNKRTAKRRSSAIKVKVTVTRVGAKRRAKRRAGRRAGTRKRRTAAQIRATKKLVALNRKRARAAHKKRPKRRAKRSAAKRPAKRRAKRRAARTEVYVHRVPMLM